MHLSEQHQLLLADDDPEERYLMHLALTDIGWANAVRFFVSGEALLKHLALLPQAQFPALLLLDLRMPRHSAPELLAILKQSATYQHLPVAVYATEMSAGLQQQLQKLGAQYCFAKARNYAEALKLAQTLRTLAHTEASA